MSAAAAAVIGGAGLLGAAISSESAANAGRAQSQAADRANQMQTTQFNQSRADQLPWLESGKANLSKLNEQMPDLTRKFTMDDFHQDPGYQFQLSQGLSAIDRSASAKGMLNSQGTMQNAAGYANNLANNSYQQALQNFQGSQQQRYSMLSGLANSGQVTAQNFGQMGQNYANQYGSNLVGGANAQGAAGIAQGNAFNGAIGTGVNAYNNQQLMSKLFPQKPPGTNTGYGGIDTSNMSEGFKMPQSPLVSRLE